MKTDERIIKRINDLLQLGDQVLATKRLPPANVTSDAYVDAQLASQWATQVQNILGSVFRESSPHYVNFSRKIHRITYSAAVRMQGVLKAALDDYENGYLFDVKNLIVGDVFSDMLEQAKHLFENGYYQAAMVLAGAVLEDTLRSACDDVDEITVANKPKLDKMNADLYKAGVYSKLVQKRITAIADIRNSAAHGKWSDFEKADVEEAVNWIERFVADSYGSI